MHTNAYHFVPTLNSSAGQSNLGRAGAWVSALRHLAVDWLERPRRPQTELPTRLEYMNARMLRDIGAPVWLIDRAAEERRDWQTLMHYLG